MFVTWEVLGREPVVLCEAYLTPPPLIAALFH